jgi:hypothetical protein
MKKNRQENGDVLGREELRRRQCTYFLAPEIIQLCVHCFVDVTIHVDMRPIVEVPVRPIFLVKGLARFWGIFTCLFENTCVGITSVIFEAIAKYFGILIY